MFVRMLISALWFTTLALAANAVHLDNLIRYRIRPNLISRPDTKQVSIIFEDHGVKLALVGDMLRAASNCNALLYVARDDEVVYPTSESFSSELPVPLEILRDVSVTVQDGDVVFVILPRNTNENVINCQRDHFFGAIQWNNEPAEPLENLLNVQAIRDPNRMNDENFPLRDTFIFGMSIKSGKRPSQDYTGASVELVQGAFEVIRGQAWAIPKVDDVEIEERRLREEQERRARAEESRRLARKEGRTRETNDADRNAGRTRSPMAVIRNPKEKRARVVHVHQDPDLSVEMAKVSPARNVVIREALEGRRKLRRGQAVKNRRFQNDEAVVAPVAQPAATVIDLTMDVDDDVDSMEIDTPPTNVIQPSNVRPIQQQTHTVQQQTQPAQQQPAQPQVQQGIPARALYNSPFGQASQQQPTRAQVPRQLEDFELPADRLVQKYPLGAQPTQPVNYRQPFVPTVRPNQQQQPTQPVVVPRVAQPQAQPISQQPIQQVHYRQPLMPTVRPNQQQQPTQPVVVPRVAQPQAQPFQPQGQQPAQQQPQSLSRWVSNAGQRILTRVKSMAGSAIRQPVPQPAQPQQHAQQQQQQQANSWFNPLASLFSGHQQPQPPVKQPQQQQQNQQQQQQSTGGWFNPLKKLFGGQQEQPAPARRGFFGW